MISKAFIYIPMSRVAGLFIFVVQLFFFRRSYIILFVGQGGYSFTNCNHFVRDMFIG